MLVVTDYNGPYERIGGSVASPGDGVRRAHGTTSDVRSTGWAGSDSYLRPSCQGRGTCYGVAIAESGVAGLASAYCLAPDHDVLVDSPGEEFVHVSPQ